MKEMVGGCCVCSDERGWPENPLVYCDGQNCTVAVHQACYGIVTVPTGPWYCRKCESQERSARVRCELCPSRDGALKRTDTQSWAHVVCALYIPEVRFGNVTTMEPIILQIPPERFSKGKRTKLNYFRFSKDAYLDFYFIPFVYVFGKKKSLLHLPRGGQSEQSECWCMHAMQ